MKDFGRNQPTPREASSSGGLNPWMMFLAGMFVGALVVAAVIFWFTQAANIQERDKDKTERSKAPPAVLQTAPAEKLQFYQDLENPKGKSATPAGAEPAAGEVAAKPRSENYYLQVGAFSRTEEADNRKAELALMGVEASIQDVPLAGGKTVHRVRIGPLSPAEATQIQVRLAEKKFEAVLIKAAD